MTLEDVGPQQYLLDTNIILHFARGDDLARRIRAEYELFSGDVQPLICVVTAGELYSLALQLSWGPSRIQTLNHLLSMVAFVPLERPGLIDTYAEIDNYSRRSGRSRAQNDNWIAAATSVTGAVLLTTDRDFDHLQGVYIDRIYIDPITT